MQKLAMQLFRSSLMNPEPHSYVHSGSFCTNSTMSSGLQWSLFCCTSTSHRQRSAVPVLAKACVLIYLLLFQPGPSWLLGDARHAQCRTSSIDSNLCTDHRCRKLASTILLTGVQEKTDCYRNLKHAIWTVCEGLGFKQQPPCA